MHVPALERVNFSRSNTFSVPSASVSVIDFESTPVTSPATSETIRLPESFAARYSMPVPTIGELCAEHGLRFGFRYLPHGFDDAAELVRLAAVARRFYVDGRSKLEIAEEFGVSRFKIARLLDQALARGIVRIEVGVPAHIDTELSERLRVAHRLHHAIVVDTPEHPETDLRAHLARVAADLLAAGHQVTMIEKDLHVLEVARPALKEAEWFPFDACEVLSLVMAGVAHADVMVAATGDDEDNLVISLLAKQEFAVPRVVARVNNPKNHGLFTEAWGVDVAVSTPHILRSLVEEAVTVGSMITVMQFERGHVSLHAVNLADRSVAVGRTLRDLALPMDAAVVAVVREGHVVVPKEDTVFAGGDEVLVVASEGSESQVRELLVGEDQRPPAEAGDAEVDDYSRS